MKLVYAISSLIVSFASFWHRYDQIYHVDICMYLFSVMLIKISFFFFSRSSLSRYLSDRHISFTDTHVMTKGFKRWLREKPSHADYLCKPSIAHAIELYAWRITREKQENPTR